MIRDFTSETEEKLLGLVAEVEDEKWFDWTDALGDAALDFMAWSGNLDVKDYTDEMEKYHKRVIDKNDTSKDDIHEIFENVYSMDDGFKVRFCALKTMNEKVLESILALTEAFKGTNFNTGTVTKLREHMYRSRKCNDILARVAGNGLRECDIDGMDESDLKNLLDNVGEAFAGMNHIEGEKEIRIPLGPNVTYYYKVKVEAGGDDAVVNTTVKDQKLKLDKLAGKFKLFDAGYFNFDTEDGASVEAEGKYGGAKLGYGKDGLNGELSGKAGPLSGKVSIDDDGLSAEGTITIGDLKNKIALSGKGIGVSSEFKAGIDTFTFKCEKEGEITRLELQVETEPEDAHWKVTSTSGLEIKKEKQPEWVRMPVPMPVTSAYECQIPDFDFKEDFDWELSKKILIGTAAVIIVVATCGAAIEVMAPAGAAVGATEAAVTVGAAETATVVSGTAAAETVVVAESAVAAEAAAATAGTAAAEASEVVIIENLPEVMQLLEALVGVAA